MSAERHSYVLDERQARVLARSQAEADALKREADRLRAEAARLSLAAGELLNDAVVVVLQAHGVDPAKVGEVDLEDGKLLATPAAPAPAGDEAKEQKPPAFRPKPRPAEAARGPAPVVNLNGGGP